MTPAEAAMQPLSRIAALADQCVMCGLCLPVCPTYAVHRHEGRSPRGRIALARLVDGGGEAAGSLALAEDLGSCLSCGRCEKACPSQVRFSDLMGEARAAVAREQAESAASWLLRWVTMRPRVFRAAVRVALWLVPHRLAPPGRGGLRLLAALAIAIGRRRDVDVLRALPKGGAARVAVRERVLLLPGCMGAAADRDTVDSARRVLEHLGFDVVVPKAALCCGSLARQAGDTATAERQAGALRRAVLQAEAETVVPCASGCHAGLRASLGANARVDDLLALLDRRLAANPGSLGAVPERVALSVPCSQRAIDGGSTLRTLMSRVPELEVHELPDAPGCCGAGGLQMVLHAETATPLRALRVDAIRAAACNLVATSNIGCRLQIEVGLPRDARQRTVCHPVRIIEASMAAAQAGGPR
jgi:glycolate oxidase iron-sulfur subunit